MPTTALVVLDTNLVLDLFLFRDLAVRPLMCALTQGDLRWICTEAMQLELVRVLAYPHILRTLNAQTRLAEQVIKEAAMHWHLVQVPEKAMHGVRCKDRDDQIFVDLAVAHQANLLSKDKAVLALVRSLKRWNVSVLRRWE